MFKERLSIVEILEVDEFSALLYKVEILENVKLQTLIKSFTDE